MVIEFYRVLERKFPHQIHICRELFEELKLTIIPAEEYHHALPLHTRIRDPDDRHLLACAIETECRFLVTGDKDLLSLGPEYQGLNIVTTTEMLALLEKFKKY